MKGKDLMHLLRVVAIVSGVISITLGLTVLIGWYTGAVILIQVYPAFVPMQYNTALGFLLSGTAI
ncbi:MAG: hypothetical protein OEV42_19605, partial [Deltaproteobacteria bacterium]|nr:hypothetical protein [Deltaproteobacteria bacterium]